MDMAVGKRLSCRRLVAGGPVAVSERQGLWTDFTNTKVALY